MKLPGAIATLALIVAAIGGWIVVERAPHMLHAPAHDALAPSVVTAAARSETPQPHWAVDPTRPGADLPATGRSLFDYVTAGQRDGKPVYHIPFPFDALVRRVEAKAGCAGEIGACTRQVLIPLGRSLQRTAASPDFFAFPRVVIAVDREGASQSDSGMLLKDRLYLGYQEKSNIVEVISYNEAAGRFEFQIVKDYRVGGSPTVVYASREMCMACHQNQAPLFSRQQWDETNVNPQIAALLARARPSFYGFPPRRGIQVPNAIDDAIHRANLFGVYQMLWQEGCGVQEPAATRCRSVALTSALQYALSGQRVFDATAREFQDEVARTLRDTAVAKWPLGLAIPNSEIPNRDAMAVAATSSGRAMSEVAARFEPLAARAPLDVWSADDMAQRFVMGLAQFFSAADVRAIDQQLRRIADARDTVSRAFNTRCTLQTVSDELRFDCRADPGPRGAMLKGRVALRGVRVGTGSIDSLAVGDGATLPLLDIGDGEMQRQAGATTLTLHPSIAGASVRLADGNAVDRIELRWRSDETADATITVRDDFAPLRHAVETVIGASIGSKTPLARGPLMAAIGNAIELPVRADLSANPHELPAAAHNLQPQYIENAPSEVALFEQPCAVCHRTPERSPPNFLQGDAQQVAAALDHCAPRIFVRLSMWQQAKDKRVKTPMPPVRAAHGGMPIEREYPPKADTLRVLLNAASNMVRAKTGVAPSLHELLRDGYENLPACLPAGA